ncbi:MAG: ribonuclease HII [Chlamydiota bacterium]
MDQQELFRLQELTSFEEAARRKGFCTVVGIDEAGRGPLAGPVVAASCFFPPEVFVSGVNDSKQLTPEKRRIVYQKLISNDQIHYNVAIVDHSVIDEINIYQATIRAMIEAVDGLDIPADYLLVDGLTLPHHSIPGEGIIKGDSKSQLIAAASIIAKETRDELMLEYHKEWPDYGFDRHKGYATKAHREAIANYGPCPIHRRSFEPIKSMVQKSEVDAVQLTIY